ncbi:MAG: glycoside hydrolase family 15 protein [Micromonosporaceae bacterium]|nr:glycoside hydrolase family 15 protein [Micromonosporaceae bacterium]
MSLVATSLAVLRSGQQPGGAFVACPTYPTYRYAWLRDGAFCAYAMDRWGEREPAAAFHRFVARTLLRRRQRVAEAIEAAGRGDVARMLPARFTLDGEEEAPGAEEWPNFQLDGYGTWLWVLADHVGRGGELTDELREAAGLVADYLRAAGELACYDCWEEYGDRCHTSTRAAVWAGLDAAARLTGSPPPGPPVLPTVDGSFVKYEGTDLVDGSLLWLALPFRLVAPDDPRMKATAERIAAELVGPGGGVRRYLGDTFYGGGEWVLLTAWLGWYRVAVGDLAGAAAARAWIEQAATAEGLLPEQLIGAPQDPAMVEPWTRRWGTVATPLLWSHAMYLVLVDAMERGA